MIATSHAHPAHNRRLISIDEILDARPQRPTATSRDRGWDGVIVDVHAPRIDCAENHPGLDHHLISYCVSGGGRLVQGRAGTVHESMISAGVSLIMPAGYDSTWSGDSAASARLRVPAELVRQAAEQTGKRCVSQVEICNIFEVRDPVIERMALALLAEMDTGPHPAQALIVDAVSIAIAAHLIRRYNALETPERHDPSPLGRMELARLTAFIEDNIDRTIGLADLAAVVNVSRFHFTRLFKRSTGHTASQFIEQCRVRRAQSLIRDTDLPLAQIALMTGFADQSHFTRRFHRQAGSTPAVYAREMGRRRSARRS
ncbi:MAG: AraC family transcriptional regulator [Sphingomonas sanxanigenens]|uniref:AraC family transcriptional regulator n=1 Tax=Sphingomonas sanxanigenens TaxID=397260 RepID=A0A2W5A735_9SPHN|nr:MAG: AraC family transcriptional regulator [Sphingomonas sanxanigenens]